MVYRNIYITHKKIPMFLFKGIDVMHYYGKIFYNIENLPNDFDDKKDIFLNCDCQFKKIKRIDKINLK
jgi:hypothetical protein